MLSESLLKLKDFFKEAAVSKQDPTVLNKSLFRLLQELCSALDSSFDPLICKEEILNLLEKICIGVIFGKQLSLSKSSELVLIRIYSSIVAYSPGYVIRNILNSFISIINTNKSLSLQGKEILIEIINKIVLQRLNDCASSITDIFQLYTKVVKATSSSNVHIRT